MTDWNPQPTDDLERDLLAIAERTLAHAHTQHACMAEVAVDQGQGMSVTVRNGEVETVEHNRDKSLAVTVYFGHRSGSASTTDFTPNALEQSVASACNIAKFTEEDDCNGLAERELLATDFPDLELSHPWALSMEQAIDLATECEQAALGFDKRISNTEGATISSHHGIDLYANSSGFRGFSRGSSHSTSCSVIAGKGDSMQRDYWYDSARDAADLDDPQRIGEESARRTMARMGARKIRTGEYPVLFEPPAAASLLGHLTSAINGANLYRKASFLLDHAGKQIFPANIRIHEQPHLPKANGSASFDGEGVATHARDIVSDGVLQGYILNSYTARKLNTTTTGNAGGVRNLEIQPTTDDHTQNLIVHMQRGLIIRELIGFGVNTVTGDYSRGAFGFWVENGEIQYPVEEFTIAGNLTQIFADIIAVGADTDTRRNLRTGAIAVKKMTVAGE